MRYQKERSKFKHKRFYHDVFVLKRYLYILYSDTDIMSPQNLPHFCTIYEIQVHLETQQRHILKIHEM